MNTIENSPVVSRISPPRIVVICHSGALRFAQVFGKGITLLGIDVKEEDAERRGGGGKEKLLYTTAGRKRKKSKFC